VRDYAKALDDKELSIDIVDIKLLDVQAEMQAKAAEFKQSGSEIYQPVLGKNNTV